MKITRFTADDFRRCDPCSRINEFEQRFPDGMDVTVEALHASADLEWAWVGVTVLGPARQKIFMDTLTKSQRAYVDLRKPLVAAAEGLNGPAPQAVIALAQELENQRTFWYVDALFAACDADLAEDINKPELMAL